MSTGVSRRARATPKLPLRNPRADVIKGALASEDDQTARARAFASPLLGGHQLQTGEDSLAHAERTAAILRGIGAVPSTQAAAYLVYASDYLKRPEEFVTKVFGESYASLVSNTRKLVALERLARDAKVLHAQQTERVRKMLLAFSNDLRVVLLRLASRLQTLRFFAATGGGCPTTLAQEAMDVFAPLANRLGIWQIKWELEDLSFRFLQPDDYLALAKQLDESRIESEQRVEAARYRLIEALTADGMDARVQGRPKHLYSIWRKMQGKNVDLAHVFDIRALRVIVADLPDCYTTLSRVHELYRPVPGEFDDYIARPKSNGYRSLHTVVLDDDGRTIEVQIRTQAMHEHSEHGVAAHWAYKEAGARGYAGVNAHFDAQVDEARKTVLHQLLAWERDFALQLRKGTSNESAVFDRRIYVLTPQAAVVELPDGATALDFAYKLHTELGHRCRGARVDGAMLALNTPLRSGQTVEIVAAKEGGPSLDWLNVELGYLQSARSRSKVRAWFNMRSRAETVARGREAVEKLLQRDGKTAIKLEDLAARSGFPSANALFEAVSKDEYSLRNVEHALHPPEPGLSPDEVVALRHPRKLPAVPAGGVLVVGVESLLTSLSRCCRPAPPDEISGYVTRGKGVSIHRSNCGNLRHMSQRAPERVIAVAWDTEQAMSVDQALKLYPVDVMLEVSNRPGLLRDVSEAFSKERIVVGGLDARTVKNSPNGSGWLCVSVEVADVTRLAPVLERVKRVAGVHSARRR